MSDSAQAGSGNPQNSSDTWGEWLDCLVGWVPAVISLVAIGFAIYLLGWGNLSSTGRDLAIAGLALAILAFLASLWRVRGTAYNFQCDSLKSCVAWLLALGGGGLVVFVLVWIMLKLTGVDSTITIGSVPLVVVIGLPLMVIVGVIVLLIVISLVTFTFSVLGLASKKQALGLPDGSVRSIIALMLLVLFSIMALYLFNSIATGKVDPAALDIAKQLITLLGTLVTAVASFYFGSNAVSSAHAAAAAAQRGNGAGAGGNANGSGPDGSGAGAGRDKKGG